MIEKRLILLVDPKKVLYFLASIIIFLLAADLIALFMKYVLDHKQVFGLVPFFDFDEEKNAPTLFSTCLFLINAVLLFYLWKAEQMTNRREKFWLLLSVMFCFLAIDEFCMVHERMIEPLRSLLGTSGCLLFAWVIPYGIAALLLAMLGIPVLIRIDRKIRSWFIASGLIFITGAIGCEMIGGKYLCEMDMLGQKDIVYAMITTLEELLEMVGLAILIFSLLSLIQKKCDGFLILFSGDGRSSASL